MQFIKKHWVKAFIPLILGAVCAIVVCIPWQNSATSLDAFDWSISKGPQEGCACHSQDHLSITSVGGFTTLSFSGYHSPGYFDYALTAQHGGGDDVVVDVNFDFSEANTTWHTLYESGFLFNIANSSSGYMVMFGQANVTLYKIDNLSSFGTTKTVIDSKVRAAGSEHSMSVHATYNHITFMDNGIVIFDQDIEPTGGIGFGPAVAYNSHSCIECSKLSFTRVTGDINKTPPIADFAYNADVVDIRTPVVVSDRSKDTNTPSSRLSYLWTVDKVLEDGTLQRLCTDQPTPFTQYNANGSGTYRTKLMVINEYGLKSNVITKDVEITISPTVTIIPEKGQYNAGDTVKFLVNNWFNCSSKNADVSIENIVSKNLYSPAITLPSPSSFKGVTGEMPVVVGFYYKDGTYSSQSVTVPASGLTVTDVANVTKELQKTVVTYKSLPALAELNKGSYITYAYVTKKPLSNYREGGVTKRKYEIANAVTYKVQLGNRLLTANNDAVTTLIEKDASFSLSGIVDNKGAITDPPACNTEFLLTGTSYGGENISKYIVVKNGKSPLIILPQGEYVLNEDVNFTLGYDKISSISVRLDDDGITVDNKTKIANGGEVPFVKPIQVANIDVSRIYESKYSDFEISSDVDFKVLLTGYPVIHSIDASFELVSPKEKGNAAYYANGNIDKLVLPVGNYTIQDIQSSRFVSLESVTVNGEQNWSRLTNTQDAFSKGKTTISTVKDQVYPIVLKYVSDEFVYDEYIYENEIHFDASITNSKGETLNVDNIDRVIVDPIEYNYPITLINSVTGEDYCGIVEPSTGISFKYLSPGKYYIECSNNMYLDFDRLEEINSDIEFGLENGRYFLIVPYTFAYAEYNEILRLVDWRGYSSLSDSRIEIPYDTMAHISFNAKAVNQNNEPLPNCKFQILKDGQPVYFVKRYNKWYYSTSDVQGAISTFVTDENGEFHIYKFPIGEYTISQMAPSSSLVPVTPTQAISVDGSRNVGIIMQFADPSKAERPISLNITSAKILLDKGESIRLSNKFAPATALKDITYTSSDTNVLTVQSDGVVTGKNKGTAKITAKSTVNDAVVSELEFTVFDSTNPDVTDFRQYISSVRLEVGESYRLTTTHSPQNALASPVTWTSSNSSVVTVSSDGTIVGKAVGSADITASIGSYKAICRVTVGRTDVAVRSISLDKNFIQLFYNNETASVDKIKATILPENASDPTITYTSSDPAIVSVDADGNLKAKASGTVSIIATTSNGLTASCAVSSETLVSRIVLNLSSTSLPIGQTTKLVANVSPLGSLNERSLKWESLNPDVATIENGIITAKKAGRTTIIVTASYPGADDVTAECSVKVVSDETLAESIDLSLDSSFSKTTIDDAIEMEIGDTTEFWARVNPEGTTNPEIEWTFSRSDTIAIGPADDNDYSSSKVINKYRISAVGTKGGDVTVLAKVKGTDIKATFKVIVDAPGTGISISKDSPQKLVLGKSPIDVLDIGVSYNNPLSTARRITWEIEDESIAEMQYPQASKKNAQVVAKKVGATKVRVEVVFRFGGTYTDEIDIIVEEPHIDIISNDIPITNLTLNVGETVNFTVEPNYPKGSASEGYEISCDNTNVSIENSGNNTANGIGYTATGVTPGMTIATITPTDPDTPPLTITITVPGITIAVDDTDGVLQLYLQATETSIPDTVTWVSGDTDIATIDNHGVITPVSSGRVTFTAVAGSKTAQITLDIDKAEDTEA